MRISAIQSSSLYNSVVVSELVVDADGGTFGYDLGANGTVDFAGSIGGSAGDRTGKGSGLAQARGQVLY